MNTEQLPPTTELFDCRALADRHPTILTTNRLRWIARNRSKNGAASAFFDSRSGELLIHEPQFLRWYLQLDGRHKPRASAARRSRR